MKGNTQELRVILMRKGIRILGRLADPAATQFIELWKGPFTHHPVLLFVIKDEAAAFVAVSRVTLDRLPGDEATLLT